MPLPKVFKIFVTKLSFNFLFSPIFASRWDQRKEKGQNDCKAFLGLNVQVEYMYLYLYLLVAFIGSCI